MKQVLVLMEGHEKKVKNVQSQVASLILQVKQVQSDLQHLKVEGISRMDERPGDSSPASGMQVAMLADIQSLKT